MAVTHSTLAPSIAPWDINVYKKCSRAKSSTLLSHATQKLSLQWVFRCILVISPWLPISGSLNGLRGKIQEYRCSSKPLRQTNTPITSTEHGIKAYIADTVHHTRQPWLRDGCTFSNKYSTGHRRAYSCQRAGLAPTRCLIRVRRVNRSDVVTLGETRFGIFCFDVSRRSRV